MNKAKSMNPDERPAVAKQTLALAYFPDSSPRVAVNHLRAWLQHCRPPPCGRASPPCYWSNPKC